MTAFRTWGLPQLRRPHFSGNSFSVALKNFSVALKNFSVALKLSTVENTLFKQAINQIVLFLQLCMDQTVPANKVHVDLFSNDYDSSFVKCVSLAP